jgi:DNA-binding CsgD family transcriptional regulator
METGNSLAEALSRIGFEYHLTEREQEALEGIVLGLTSKEVAARMGGISPNTVKAFLRLIMIKMGVTSRAAIVAKLLGCGDEEALRL